MSESFVEIAILEDICSLPKPMQKIYLQLVAAIDISLQRLQPAGAVPSHLSEDFIESLVDELLDSTLSAETLQEKVNAEFMRGILEQADVPMTT